MRRLLSSLFFVTLLLGSAVSIAAPAAVDVPPVFDGDWSVSVVTEKGPCDPGYRFEVRVANGLVNYSGSKDFVIGGTVSPTGHVSVSIRHGERGANGTGRLTASTGAGIGVWVGVGSNGTCSGYWEAERH